MGVERAVTRWYVQRQLLLDEIASLEATAEPSTSDDGSVAQQTDAETLQKLTQAREKLRTLGVCPRPMMG